MNSWVGIVYAEDVLGGNYNVYDGTLRVKKETLDTPQNTTTDDRRVFKGKRLTFFSRSDLQAMAQDLGLTDYPDTKNELVEMIKKHLHQCGLVTFVPM